MEPENHSRGCCKSIGGTNPRDHDPVQHLTGWVTVEFKPARDSGNIASPSPPRLKDSLQREVQLSGVQNKGPGQLDFDEECICRHLFLCGATGSGKTTMLRAITRQLIASHTDDPDLRPGLVILDSKGDGTVEHVRAAAAAAGRSADVRVLSLDSDTSYDFFGECRSIKHAAEFAERLQFGCGGMTGGADVFWHEFRHTLLAAAVTWLSSIHGANRSFSDWISHASAWLLAERLSTQHSSEIETLREKAAELSPGTSDRIALDHALRLVEE